MSRGFDFVVAGVIFIIAITVHLMAVELLAPGTALHATASQAVNIGGAQKADTWYLILSRWVPLISSGGIIAWVFIREYRRQSVTTIRPR